MDQRHKTIVKAGSAPHTLPATASAIDAPAASGQDDSIAPVSTFAGRIKLLIQHVGSVTEIARRCGFSEGVVRSWRDGHADPSRARCVTLAQTLGVSLLWLVAGEGPIRTPDVPVPREPARAETPSPVSAFSAPTPGHLLDTQRLAAAMEILHSNLQLAGSPLTLIDSVDLLTELYEALGPQGISKDPQALVAFQQHLAAYIRQTRAVPPADDA